jgi:hypothetical protein
MTWRNSLNVGVPFGRTNPMPGNPQEPLIIYRRKFLQGYFWPHQEMVKDAHGSIAVIQAGFDPPVYKQNISFTQILLQVKCPSWEMPETDFVKPMKSHDEFAVGHFIFLLLE